LVRGRGSPNSLALQFLNQETAHYTSIGEKKKKKEIRGPESTSKTMLGRYLFLETYKGPGGRETASLFLFNNIPTTLLQHPPRAIFYDPQTRVFSSNGAPQ